MEVTQMSDRIAHAFTNKAKIAYLTAGDGGSQSAAYFLALTKGGANILEIGIPFSDPVADGSTIQAAMERSLKLGTNVAKTLALVQQIRLKTESAIIIFTYYNPIAADIAKALSAIKNSGADGLLIVDLPHEEAGDIRFWCNLLGLALITVIAPSTPIARVRLLSSVSRGFIYYACNKGTTGVRKQLPQDVFTKVRQLQQNVTLPVAVGFGVSNADMVNQVLSVADGCVVGSYFVNAIAQNKTPLEVEQLAFNIFGLTK